MTDLAKGSLEDRTAIAHALGLLTHYSFDLGDRSALQLIEQWLEKYPPDWIRWAIIEALYQGRYKAISADQILQLWLRRNQARYHFSYEFERLVCHKFPRNLLIAQGGRKPLLPEPSMAVLPTLPAPAVPNREPEQSPTKPPAWAALAEQIQQDDPESTEDAAEAPTTGAAADLMADPAALHAPTMRSMAHLQADVTALIDQATSTLNASAEAMKTRLQVDENGHPHSGYAEALAPEDPYPPIHQFTPDNNGSEFHSKLRSVANQDPDEA